MSEQSSEQPSEHASAGFGAGRKAPVEGARGEHHYGVEEPQVASGASTSAGWMLEAPQARGALAVLVAHGMGQQIPFETLDSVAEGLRAAAKRAGRPLEAVARTVRVGDVRLQRIELMPEPGGAEQDQVHVYEAYWAPLTEGKVTLRDVTRFLLDAARNGLGFAGRSLTRWIFGRERSFVVPGRTLIYLLVLLALLLCMGLMNAAIVAVVVARSSLTSAGTWLSHDLYTDLTTTLDLFLIPVALFGAVLAVCARGWFKELRRVRRALGWLSIGLFLAVFAALLAAGAAMPLLIYAHHRRGIAAVEAGREGAFWASTWLFGNGNQVNFFNRKVEEVLLVVGLLLGAWFVGSWLVRLLRSVVADASSRDGWFTVLVMALGALVLASAAGLLWTLAVSTPLIDARGLSGLGLDALPWALLVALSFFFRKFLIEYVGDAAAYVTSHKLDRFQRLRDAIKERVLETCRAVYQVEVGGRPYSQVLVVGHSLGSVVVYDALNRLLLDDSLARDQLGRGLGEQPEAPYLNVLGRTLQLVTFGSPLDKTAFLFSLQKHQTTEAREALATSLQPLIRAPRFRSFPWLNVFSRFDVISGSLKFYDPPETTRRSTPGANGTVSLPGIGSWHAVENVTDPEATTWLLAHVEYWRNKLLFDRIYSALQSVKTNL